MSDTKIALVQMQCGTEPENNLAHAIDCVREAAKQGAQIVCLPELFRSQYFCQSEDHANFALAEEIPGPTTDSLGKLAAELKVVIIASLFEKRGAGVYHNTAAIIDADGKLLGRYRKMHIPDDPLYHEKFYFTPGDLGFQNWKTAQGNIGVCVCWDQWYPEAARLTALRGAEILFYPTAIGWHPGEKEAIRRGATFRVGNDPAQSRNCQRLLRRRRESSRPRSDRSVATGSNSGAKVSSRRRAAKLSPREVSIRKNSLSPISIGSESTNIGRTGRFCAIAASMRTAGFKSA